LLSILRAPAPSIAEPGRMREPWKPGQAGNPKGRPPGSRNKLGEAFVEALYKDFVVHGAKAIVTCRETKPDVYPMVVSKIVPKELNLKTDGQEAFIKICESISSGLFANPDPEDEDEHPAGHA
jgi:hypothetical protein